MSETASFVDPVFLARFGLSRANVLDYFLHPLNPFRTQKTFTKSIKTIKTDSANRNDGSGDETGGSNNKNSSSIDKTNNESSQTAPTTTTTTTTTTTISNNTSNEVLAMQGIGIGILMQQGTTSTGGFPMSPQDAEEEYHRALTRLTGVQYELVPPVDPIYYTQPSSLYTIRHVYRTNPRSVKVLGIYYVVEGVIYKAPSVRSLSKAHVSRTLEGLQGAASALSVCARYQPATGYTWHFDNTNDDNDDDDHDHDIPFDEDTKHGDQDNNQSRINDDDLQEVVALRKLHKRMKRRKVLDNRKAGERNEAEEEGLRSSQAMDQILVRIASSYIPTITANATTRSTPSTTTSTTNKANNASATTTSRVLDLGKNTKDGEGQGQGQQSIIIGGPPTIAVAEPPSANSSTTGVSVSTTG